MVVVYAEVGVCPPYLRIDAEVVRKGQEVLNLSVDPDAAQGKRMRLA